MQVAREKDIWHIGVRAGEGDTPWRHERMARTAVPVSPHRASHLVGQKPGRAGSGHALVCGSPCHFRCGLLLLLIFILKNSQEAHIAYFGLHSHMPLRVVALLLAAGHQ